MFRSEVFTTVWDAFDVGDLVPVCAWCGRLRLDGSWVGPAPGVLLTIDGALTLSHSICPRCTAGLSAEPDGTPARPAA